MNVRDPNLKAAIARLLPAELAALERVIRTGERSQLAKEAFRKVKAWLKRMARR
jgi:hypothetical protein